MVKSKALLTLFGIGLSAVFLLGVLSAAENLPESSRVERLFKDGNYSDALQQAKLLLDSAEPPADESVRVFKLAIQCFQHLNRLHELDEFRETVVKRHGDQWQVLSAVAQSWLHGPYYGYQIAGEFRRGHHRGGGKVLNATARDRVRALQLYWRALRLLKEQTTAGNSNAVSNLLQQLSHAIMHGNNFAQAWRLQSLTDLDDLPDYEEGWGYHHGQPQGAPVDADGKPILYEIPESWETATNDGERWRWLLQEAARWNPNVRRQLLVRRAEFLKSQFGVQTMAQYGWWFDRQGSTTDSKPETGTFALHTLAENETMAKLATGIQRFQLPDQHNHLKLFQEAEGDPQLAAIFENRRQYERAAEYWQTAIDKNINKQHAQQRLDQIFQNWGRFEAVMAQPAGQGASVDFRFRNGKRVEFVAHRIKVNELLADVKKYLSASPGKLDWQQTQIENLGHRLVTQSRERYVGAEVARWSLDLDPREAHFDRRITVTTPLQKAGAYLLTSTMDDGNTTSIVLWLNDTAIVKKPLSEKSLYYVADAITGQPVPNCNVEFFGFWQKHLDGNKYQVFTKNFAELTDEAGFVELTADENNRRHQWVAIATTENGRFAYLGFRGVWSGNYHEQEYQQVKVFTMTDRPVYRPEQKVQFKFWVRHTQYDLEDESKYAAQSFQIEVRDPKNEKVYSTQVIADAYGGLEGEWEIPPGTTLGQYRINVVNHGGGSFRVEEYKKPEFEVTVDAPSKPVRLGDRISAQISANYYFGSPVTSGKVKYKVLRTSYQQRWYPPMPWDWLYGPGYWWFGRDYHWYPGWSRWGCVAPSPWWFWRAPTPPEVVAEREVELGPDGTIEIEIDTATALQFHPDQDHSYQIQAEVVDQSRRTIVANGRVLVAREPFKVHLWLDRGYYSVGDTIVIGSAARTLDAKPVAGDGVLRLLKIQYENNEPVETEVGRWELATGDAGQAELQIKASEPGQYRVSYELTNSAGHTIEGGQVLTVTGQGFDGAEFRFNDLELVPDLREYQPGDKLALQINTNRTGAAVLLFLRPSNGIYQRPQLIRLTGKSKIVEIDVAQKDMPNFFVEAVTVHGGKSHIVTRELFVPPARRVLNVEVAPSADAYLPGQAAKMLLKLTDENGEPFVGSMAVAIYDKAVEYIAGGSNVAGIREFFWKWRRSHRPRGETNLQRHTSMFVERDKPSMHNLGVFGNELVPGSMLGEFAAGGGLGGAYGDLRGQGQRFRSDAKAVPMAAAQVANEGFAGAFGDRVDADFQLEESDAQSPAPTIEPTVRQNFVDTALWVGSLETNDEGIAEVELDMPENLTTWKVKAWGMGHGTKVGEGETEVVTRKNIIVRLQAPRFFVERDEVVLSAIVHNYLPEAKQITVKMELEGDSLFTISSQPAIEIVEVEAGGEQRVDWRVKVAREGLATIRMSALTDTESDAMQLSFPVHVHGMQKTDSYTGVVRPSASSAQFSISIPEARRPEQTRLELRYTPTLAGAMVDALPYLIDYPYGCTEQTLNRFLPAVITQQTLRKMGIDLAAIQAERTNLNAQEIGDDVERSKDWQRFDRNPVFDQAELDKIVKTGVNRLTEMQLSDGGWGWFSGWGERSSAHTTAVVMHGLLVAQKNGVAIVPSVRERGTTWLENYQAEQIRKLENWAKINAEGNRVQPYKQRADNLDALVYLVLTESGRNNRQMGDYLYRDRTNLAVYSLATYGLALHLQGDTEKLDMVMRNLSQFVRQDDENHTAWLEMPANGWWVWYGSEYEAHAYYLKLLAATEPDSEIAPRLVKYLLNNRKHATYWNSTRDTALVVEAFADYLAASGEDDPEVTVDVWIDGRQRKQVSISRENLFTFDNKLVLTGEALSTGRHTIEIRKQGKSPIYFNAYLTNFTLEDDIAAAGLEIKVARNYYKLTPANKTTEVAGSQGQIVDQRVEKYDRQQLVNLSELTSGDLVEVELVVDSKNDYEYILLEDLKAAGFEPVEVRSGYTGNEMGAYVEFRDDRVGLFVTRLARGQHSVSYRLRAEIPGQFSALPTRVSAMYAPELKANSDELKLRIAD
ncbi:MAG: MG2 domain-containing protein [Bythopirellula sp.]